jgi:hypothetical protein
MFRVESFAWGRRPFVEVVIGSKTSGPPAKGGSPWISGAERPAAKNSTEAGDTSLQFFVNLVELIEPVQLKHGRGEPAQNADEQKREPQLQAPANRIWKKRAAHASMQ